MQTEMLESISTSSSAEYEPPSSSFGVLLAQVNELSLRKSVVFVAHADAHRAEVDALRAKADVLRAEGVVREKRVADLVKQLGVSKKREQQLVDELAGLKRQLHQARNDSDRIIRRSVQDSQRREAGLIAELERKNASQLESASQLARVSAQLRQRDSQLKAAQAQVKELRRRMDERELVKQQQAFMVAHAFSGGDGSHTQPADATTGSSPVEESTRSSSGLHEPSARSKPAASKTPTAEDEKQKLVQQQHLFISRMLASY
uniref:Uncharacterized protein n=1 Tax=Coccolithus braarudii TaxID=221442 RepID=A0A6T7GUP3_9EUKA|mmetsp:Transcript_33447/g.71395  ORF Transcript_33447/g.71395 Transcript_33447/m.71395 type:complete len:261 (+) Transcript_33447:52-834(+)|eukprot:CAMPEP_0183345256 /NCGR_PEP_ID=MMETSP0164_2-20130417/10745_1 /TAXON_ID=221442 /ORGANISM="Coccolithus pelagicus ssp braarudi, Strain PLY182g" /LENGTH=260 /DNA_ID=CAMNT_0025516383 /DNA_START=50 /DNA_END=832 /DNA_ORIENTATION=-